MVAGGVVKTGSRKLRFWLDLVEGIGFRNIWTVRDWGTACFAVGPTIFSI
jgi:hypothetical protein